MEQRSSGMSLPGSQADAFYDLLQPTPHSQSSGAGNAAASNRNSDTGFYDFSSVEPSFDFQPLHGNKDKSSAENKGRDWLEDQRQHEQKEVAARMPLREAPAPTTYNNPDTSWQSGVNPQSNRRGAEQEAIDLATVGVVERTMKKYADNLLSALGDLSSKLHHLERTNTGLEAMVRDLQRSVGDSHGEVDGRLRSLENGVHEVQRGVQVLRDRLEIADAQAELAKMKVVAGPAPPSPPLQAAEAVPLPPAPPQQQLPPLPQLPSAPPQSEPVPTGPPAPSAPAYGAPSAGQPDGPAYLPSLPALPAPTPPQSSHMIPPNQQLPPGMGPPPGHHPQQQVPPPPPPPSQQPLQPSQISHGPPPSAGSMGNQPPWQPPPPPPQNPQYSQPPPPYLPQQDPYPPTSAPQLPYGQPQQQQEAPPPYLPNYGGPQQQGPPPQQPRQQAQPPPMGPQYSTPPPSAMYEALNFPPSRHQFNLPQAQPTQPGSMYDAPPGQVPGGMYGSPPALRVAQPVPSAPSSAGSGGGGYPRLQLAQPVAQAGGPPNPAGGPGGNPPMSSSRVPIDKVIEDVSAMGFTKEQVRNVVRRLTENGQSVDLNVVLDKLMNGDNSQTQKSWFGR